MMERVDVLVVGCGPAGAAAAAAAAEAGARVLVVEKRQRVGVPVQCAEFIPLPLAAAAQAPGVVKQRISGMNTCLPSGRWVHTVAGGLMIDRAAFDRHLANRAQAAGAALATGTALIALDAAARVACLKDGHGVRQVGYGALVAADGPLSRVGRLLGLVPLVLLWTRQYTFRLARAHADTDVWLGEDFPGGYAWFFPRGGTVNVGLGLAGPAEQLKGRLTRLCDHLIAQGRLQPPVLSRTGGAIPVGGLRPRLVTQGVVFAGDAAGLTHPVSGAGIAAAVDSGAQAGRAAAAWVGGRRHALGDYEEAVREVYGPSLDRALARRRELWRKAKRSDEDFRRGWVGFAEYFARDGDE